MEKLLPHAPTRFAPELHPGEQTHRPRNAERNHLADSLTRAIHRRTGGRIRNLRVDVEPRGVVLSGHCESFYCKQLAQSAAMGLIGKQRLTNEIEVL